MAGSAHAQDKPKRAAPSASRISVKIICVQWGTQKPRAPAAGVDPTYRLIGHKLRWEIGPLMVRTPALLTTLARRRARGKHSPVGVLVPYPETTVGDVVEAYDALRDAGITRFELPVDPHRARGEPRPTPDQQRRTRDARAEIRLVAASAPAAKPLPNIVLPTSRRAIKPKPRDWQPVMTIDQRGRCRVGSVLAYDRERDSNDFSGVGRAMATLAAQAEDRKLIVRQPDDTRTLGMVSVPVLVRVDEWTEFYYLGKAMCEMRRPGAVQWRVEIAVRGR